ncbi:MAG: ABC transporter substrate-binding protein, partial [Methylococcales bacterium]|nr:ABC transporter substrate-binding protein [Methylococcales bacterium]
MNTRVCNDNYFLTIFSILLGLLTVSPSMASELLAPQIPIELSSRTLKNKIESDVTFKDDFNKATLFIETVINPHVDFNRVSALVLGKLWKKATTDEKLRFR